MRKDRGWRARIQQDTLYVGGESPSTGHQPRSWQGRLHVKASQEKKNHWLGKSGGDRRGTQIPPPKHCRGTARECGKWAVSLL